jgi:hypothetical protein
MARLVKFLATATMIFASTAQIASANVTYIGRPFNDQTKKRKGFCLPNNFTGEDLQ